MFQQKTPLLNFILLGTVEKITLNTEALAMKIFNRDDITHCLRLGTKVNVSHSPKNISRFLFPLELRFHENLLQLSIH